jgi:hypothetical protein
MPLCLIAGVVASSPRSRLDPKPHVWFNIRSEGDERIWRVTILDEDEVGGAETLRPGDALSVVGALDVHAAQDARGYKRIAYCLVAKQLLLLRNRSPVKAAASSFFEEPMAGGVIR